MNLSLPLIMYSCEGKTGSHAYTHWDSHRAFVWEDALDHKTKNICLRERKMYGGIRKKQKSYQFPKERKDRSTERCRKRESASRSQATSGWTMNPLSPAGILHSVLTSWPKMMMMSKAQDQRAVAAVVPAVADDDDSASVAVVEFCWHTSWGEAVAVDSDVSKRQMDFNDSSVGIRSYSKLTLLPFCSFCDSGLSIW